MTKSQIGLSDLIDVLGIKDPVVRAAALDAIADRVPTAANVPFGVEIEFEPAPRPTQHEETPAQDEFFAATRLLLRTATPAEPKKHRSVEPPPPCEPVRLRPLMTQPELLAAVRERLRTDLAGTEPDIPSIVERVSRCVRIEPVPRQKRRRWGNNLFLIEDRSKRLTPYRHDQGLVTRWLAEAYPRDRITVLQTRDESPEIWTTYPVLRLGYEMPHPGDTVFALSDLGSLARDESDASVQRWVDLGRRFRDNGSHTLALVPATLSSVPPSLHSAWTALPWGTRKKSVGTRDDAFATLLAMASQATRLEPGLLRELRLLFASGRDDPGLESLVWQHESLSSRSLAGASFHARALPALRRDFASLAPALKKAALATIRNWVKPKHDLCWAPTVLALDPGTRQLLSPSEVDRAVDAMDEFATTRCGKSMDLASRVWASSTIERLRDCPVDDAALTQALNAICREVQPNAQSGPAPIWFDPAAAPTEATAEREIRVWVVENELHLAERAFPSSDPADENPGPPLATIRSRNGVLLLGRHDPFWASGKAPAWASAWGVDEYGRWAEFAIGGATQRMRWIEPGTFRMGSPEDEEGRLSWEGPVHEVTITRGYWLFDTLCCQDLWEAVLGADPSRFPGKRRPVELVTWEEAVAFLDRLSESLPGLELRLPREAEWEYACRAGTSTARYGELGAVAWHDGNSGGTTHDVGQKRANAWGLYDTLGNVWEWCLDSQRQYTKDAAIDPDGGRAAVRVIRGGGWISDARFVRAAFRHWYRPDDRSDNLGFRALSSGASPAPGGRVRIGYLRRAEPDARGSAPEAPKKTRIPVHGPVTEDLPSRNAFQLQSDVETCVFERIAKPSWARDFGRDRYGLWCTLEIGNVVQRMRWLPPGRFLMGSPPEEEGRYEDEGPMHPVVLTSGYWLFDTPCTQALWSAVMNGDNPSRFRDPLRPVEYVTHEMVQDFLKAINRAVDGLGLTLPTEAQWEYACRAGTTTATYAGDLKIRGENDAPMLDAIAWYGGNSGHKYDLKEGYDSSDWEEKQYPHTKAGTRRVATKDANGWGLYDMLGNVWEWCADLHREYTNSLVVDPVGERGAVRVVRGGCWASHARLVRAADRNWYSPDDRYGHLGFRALSSGASSGKAGRDASG